nr:MAG TPA: hypothetical protein [Caudoviricetes sp.]
MSASEKTTNYDLGIYVGTDVTDWLGTFNGNMNKIDAQMKVNANGVASANQTAGKANSTATAASEKVDTLETNVNKNGTDIQALQSTVKSQDTAIKNNAKAAQNAKNAADTAQDTANNANNGVNSIIQWNKAQLTIESGSGTVYLLWNKELKIFNIIGGINIGNGNNGASLVGTSLLTGLPQQFFTDMGFTEDRKLYNLGLIRNGNGGNAYFGIYDLTLRLNNRDVYASALSGTGSLSGDRASQIWFSSMSYAGFTF